MLHFTAHAPDFTTVVATAAVTDRAAVASALAASFDLINDKDLTTVYINLDDTNVVVIEYGDDLDLDTLFDMVEFMQNNKELLHD